LGANKFVVSGKRIIYYVLHGKELSIMFFIEKKNNFKGLHIHIVLCNKLLEPVVLVWERSVPVIAS
jgi:predicted RNA-binding protein associated with RNAse of E/G family